MDITLLDAVLEAEIQSLGDKGLAYIQSKLQEMIASQTDGWKKTALQFVSGSVATFGVAGINKALSALHGLIEGKATDISFDDLEAGSTLLAKIENDEADKKTECRDFFMMLGQALADIVTGALKAL